MQVQNLLAIADNKSQAEINDGRNKQPDQDMHLRLKYVPRKCPTS